MVKPVAWFITDLLCFVQKVMSVRSQVLQFIKQQARKLSSEKYDHAHSTLVKMLGGFVRALICSPVSWQTRIEVINM